MRIIGISAYHHDSAAALVQDGRIIAAAQEERFTRKKHDQGFPANALRYCLEEGGLKPEEVDHVAFYDKPFLKFERLLETYLSFAPKGYTSFRMALPLWLSEKLFQKRLLNKELKAFAPDAEWEKRLLFSEHHLSHAVSAFHALLSAYKGLTGCGVLVNTSFNVRGEPIVCTPEDAFRCFMGSEIEVLTVGNCYLEKEEQNPALKKDYKNAFELD
jgi:predicted NodU family carbamoyl transferase